MDCISVYAAGFHNVIASSGTAFTEIQAKLLGASQKMSSSISIPTLPEPAPPSALSACWWRKIQYPRAHARNRFDPDLFIRRRARTLRRGAQAFAEIF